MKSGKKGVAISAMVYFMLGIATIGIILYSTIGQDGLIIEGDEEVTGIQDDVVDMMDNLREELDMSRNDAPPPQGLSDLWENFVEDVGEAKLKDSEEYCIIPFQRTLFANDDGEVRLSEVDNIRLLEAGDDVLVIMNYGTSRGNLDKSLTIRDMDLYFAYPDTEINGDGSVEIPDAFPPLDVQDVTEVKTEDSEGGISISGDLDDIFQEEDNFHQPIYAVGEDISDQYTDGYIARISPQDPDEPGLREINFPTTPYDSMVLANKDSIIFLGDHNAERRDEHNVMNLMKPFDGDSVQGTNLQGLEFCNPQHESQLASSECSCSDARNRAMCHSLTSDNCGASCIWREESTSPDGTVRREAFCEVVDDDKLAILNAFAQLFADMYAEISESQMLCRGFVETREEYDDMMDLRDSEDFRETLNDAEMILQNGEVELVSSTGFSSDTFEIPDPSGAVSDRRDTMDFSVFEGYEDSSTVGTVIYVDGSELHDTEDGFAVVFEYESDGLSLDLKEFDNVAQEFEDTETNVNFCNKEVPYSMGLVDEDDSCDDIGNGQTCIFHENEGGCYSKFLDGETLRAHSDQYICESIITENIETTVTDFDRHNVDLEHGEVESTFFIDNEYDMELLQNIGEMIEDGCVSRHTLDESFADREEYNYEIYEIQDEKYLMIIKSFEGGFAKRDGNYYHIHAELDEILEETELSDDCFTYVAEAEVDYDIDFDVISDVVNHIMRMQDWLRENGESSGLIENNEWHTLIDTQVSDISMYLEVRQGAIDAGNNEQQEAQEQAIAEIVAERQDLFATHAIIEGFEEAFEGFEEQDCYDESVLDEIIDENEGEWSHSYTRYSADGGEKIVYILQNEALDEYRYIEVVDVNEDDEC